MNSVRVVAPAKVNLLLAIGCKLPSGYHEAVTVMHALALHDTVEASLVEAGEKAQLFEPCDAAQPLRQVQLEAPAGSGLVASANMVWAAGLDPVAVADEDNLACRAVHALAQALGRTNDEHMRLLVRKAIPAQAGLGGGSADAAAALVAAAHLWGVAADADEVVGTAQQLGADVAFFLRGGCALLDGRGERFVHALEPRRDAVALVKPAGGVSTGKAYALFDQGPCPVDEALVHKARHAQKACDVPLANNLSQAAEQLLPGLADVRAFAHQQPGVQECLVAGSGAGTFLVCDSYASAQAAVAAARVRGWWARATSFASWGASLLP